jgi:ankyrin repeat protein
MVEFQSIPVEVMAVVMGNLDYKSNVQLIRTCKKLHDFYAQKENNGLLFTDHYLNSTDYMNAMVHFSRNDDVEKVKLLMEHEGEENKNNREDITLYFFPDQATIQEDAIDVYRRKYDKDAVLDVRRLMKEPAVLQLVLKQGYQNFNYCDEDGFAPLHYAIILGKFDDCKSLLSLGALVDPNIKNKYGKTPAYLIMQIASIDRMIEILHCFIAHPQFNPNVQSSGGNTLLHEAVQVFDPNDTVKILNCLLSDARVDCNIRNDADKTLLDYVVDSGYSEVFKCLFADPSRIDCNSKNKRGNTVYDLAYDLEVKRLLAPRMSFINKHKQQMIALICKVPDLMRLGVSIGMLIDLVFFGGKRTSETLHTIIKAFGY